MNPAAYREMADTERLHWWFAGRRAIVASVIGRMRLPPEAKIVEIGCGTGGNLEMLARFGRVSAIERDANARSIAMARTRHRHDIRAGSCPDALPVQAETFDLVCLLDVLEHIDDDAAALAAAARLLAPRGCILVTVPAYAWLWGPHDEFLHHRRRYGMRTLLDTVRRAGLRAVEMSYFNTLLFPLLAAARLAEKALQRPHRFGTRVPGAAVNAILRAMFSAERFALGRLTLPFGASILGVLRAP